MLTQVALFGLVYGVRRIWADTFAPFGLAALMVVLVPAAVGVQQSVTRAPTGFCRGSVSGLIDVCGPDSLVRAVGTFSNPNLLAAFLTLMLPLAVLGAATLADRGSRIIGGAVVMLGYAAIVLSGSRAALIAASLGGAAFFVSTTQSAYRRTLAGIFAVAIAGMVGGFAIAAGGSAGIRTDVWAAALRSLVEHPLGVGLGRGGAVISRLMPGDEEIEHAHNLWLNWAVEAGWPGLLAVVGLTVAVVVRVQRARRRSIALRAGACGLLGFATVCLVDAPSNSLRVAFALWAVIGVLAADASGAASTPTHGTVTRP